MDIRTTPTPGQYGTKQLLKEYGDQLVGVRYRYDKKRNKRYKTVELIVDEQEWNSGVSIPMERHVHVRVEYGETGLRQKVKSAGGFWNVKKKAWVLSYKTVLQMELDERMVGELLP
ncbi:MAG: hypothetical protein RPU73_00175 [Candidatus Sedimenticola sp. (ex Thyasira tokunagai)]